MERKLDELQEEVEIGRGWRSMDSNSRTMALDREMGALSLFPYIRFLFVYCALAFLFRTLLDVFKAYGAGILFESGTGFSILRAGAPYIVLMTCLCLLLPQVGYRVYDLRSAVELPTLIGTAQAVNGHTVSVLGCDGNTYSCKRRLFSTHRVKTGAKVLMVKYDDVECYRI